MNRTTIAAAAVGVVALIVIGLGIALSGDDPSADPPLAGDRPNPFGEEAGESEPPPDDSGESGSTDDGDQDGDANSPSATPAPTLPTTTRVLDTSVAVLVYAEARVTLGGGARYAYLGDPADRTEYNELLREAAETEDGAEELADPDPDVYQTVTNASCAVAQENILTVTRGGPVYQELRDISFGADFRVDQENFFSIADNGAGIVTGGLSQGEGGRTTSEQWEIFAGSLNIRAQRLDPSDEFFGRLTSPLVFVTAAWQGTSIENFSGEEAAGTVVVNCLWRVPE